MDFEFGFHKIFHTFQGNQIFGEEVNILSFVHVTLIVYLLRQWHFEVNDEVRNEEKNDEIFY